MKIKPDPLDAVGDDWRNLPQPTLTTLARLSSRILGFDGMTLIS